MFEQSLTYIKESLKTYLTAKYTADSDTLNDLDGQVILENIANFDAADASSPMVNKIVISLVNIEEESTLKNNAFIKRKASGAIDYVDPPVHVNLYLLFTSTPSGTGSKYERALVRLSYVIQFFQHQRRFETAINFDGIEEKVRLVFELYTLTFEQINHLWGSLGGKQIPFVMYKVRLVKLQEIVPEPAELIEEIDSRVGHKYN